MPVSVLKNKNKLLTYANFFSSLEIYEEVR